MFTCMLGAIGCFHSLNFISTQTFRRALTASVDTCADAEIESECPFSGVTKYGRVWRKVPESDVRTFFFFFSPM